MSADDPKRRLSVHDVIGALGDLPEGEDSVSVIRKQRDAADRPSVTDNARAEREAAMDLYRALRRANPDAWAEIDEVEDWAYWEDIVRTAQLTSAEGSAETTTATPPGLTVSEDGSVLNWQGVNYVPQRAETTTEAVERIARQIARETAMTGRDALELVEAVQALQDAETTTATTEDAEEVLHGAGWFARADLDPRDLRGILHDLADADLLATARTRPTREQIDRAVGKVLFNASNHPDPAAVLGRSIEPLRTKITDAVLELLRDGAR